MRGPLLFSQPHEPARKTTSPAEVAVGHHGQVVALGLTKIHIVGVVHHQHPHSSSQGVQPAHQIEHLGNSGNHVGLAVKRGDRQTEPHVVPARHIRMPLHVLHTTDARGHYAHIQHSPRGGPQRAHRQVDWFVGQLCTSNYLLAPAGNGYYFSTAHAGCHHSHCETINGGEPTPTPGMEHAKRCVERQHAASANLCRLVTALHGTCFAHVQQWFSEVVVGQQRTLQQKLHYCALIRAGRPRTPESPGLARLLVVPLGQSAGLRE